MTTVHLLLVAAFTLHVLERQRGFLTGQAQEQTEGLAQLLAVNASSWVLAHDVAGLGEMVASLSDLHDLRYALVASAQGQVLAHTEPDKVGRYLVDPPSRALLHGPPRLQVIHADAALLDVAAPVLSGTGECIGWVRVGQGQQSIAASLAVLRRDGLLYGAAASALGVLFAAVVGSRLSARIRRLRAVSQGVRAGRKELRTGLAGHDEFGELGAAFDAMLDDLQAREREAARLEAELLHAQKLESVGRLAGGVAHDFNNLLTAIVGNAESLLEGLPEGDQRTGAAEILEAGRRATEVTRGLLAFSRKQLQEPARLDLCEVVRGFERLVARIIGEDIHVVVRAPGTPLEIMGNRGQLEQVLMNLATNARDAMKHGGTFTVEVAEVALGAAEVALRGLASGRMARISVRDTGGGMDAATRARVFDPFFTTKEVGKGTGLGLAMVYGNLRQHGGFVDVQSAPGEGTTFQLFLPLAPLKAPGEAAASPVAGAGRAAPAAVLPAALPPPPAPPGEPAGPAPRETILLAEDDATLRSFASRVLRNAGYRVIVAADGREAVREFAAHRGEVQLCLFDLVMPHASGRAAYHEIRQEAPGVPVLFVSGYSPEAEFRDAPPGQEGSLLLKPYLPSELLARVQAVLDQAALARRQAAASGAEPVHPGGVSGHRG